MIRRRSSSPSHSPRQRRRLSDDSFTNTAPPWLQYDAGYESDYPLEIKAEPSPTPPPEAPPRLFHINKYTKRALDGWDWSRPSRAFPDSEPVGISLFSIAVGSIVKTVFPTEEVAMEEMYQSLRRAGRIISIHAADGGEHFYLFHVEFETRQAARRAVAMREYYVEGNWARFVDINWRPIYKFQWRVVSPSDLVLARHTDRRAAHRFRNVQNVARLEKKFPDIITDETLPMAPPRRYRHWDDLPRDFVMPDYLDMTYCVPRAPPPQPTFDQWFPEAEHHRGATSWINSERYHCSKEDFENEDDWWISGARNWDE